MLLVQPWTGARDAWLLVAVALLSFVGQLLLTRSLQLLRAYIALSIGFIAVRGEALAGAGAS